MPGSELSREDIERLVRVEQGVKFLVDSELSRMQEVVEIKKRLSILESWQSRMIGIVSVVSVMAGAAFSWLLGKI